MRQFPSVASGRSKPRLPEGTRVYAVGDVHGRADLLDRVLFQIDAHLSRNPVSRAIEVFLGDYVDRGPDSRRVIDLLIARREKRETICLKGNHETYLLEFLKDPNVFDIWIEYGGLETLLSYGVSPPKKPTPGERKQLARSFAKLLPKYHLRFLSQLKTSFTCGDFLFVHAGVQPGVPLKQQREEHLLWIRDDFLRADQDFEKYVVHGHTPVKEPDIRPNRVNIHTGAFATGRLTCLMIEGEELQVIPQESDDLREVSSAPLATATIAEIDFLPAAEFPNLADNSPAIIPQKESIENAVTGESSQPAKDTFTRPARSTDERANWGSSEEDTFTRARPAATQGAQLINRERDEDISSVARPRLPRFVATVVIALLALGAASTLIFPNLIPKLGTVDQNRVLPDTGSKDLSADSAQTEQPAPNLQPEPRLVLEPNLSGRDGASVPLGARVSGEAPGLALEISGLPEGMTISTGRPLGTGAWRILADEVADATINPPPGFGGAIDLTVELRLADDTVIDHGSLHREWPQPPAAATASVAPADTVSANSADHETSAASGPNQNAVSSAADSQLDHAQIDFLIERSQSFLSEGDVVSARIQLRRAAEARDARAALALGATYDPIMLAILKVNGVAADVSQARYWYQKAKEYGSLEAAQRLKLLETLRETSSTTGQTTHR
jgi:serine/threonine protein phosphatase 1